MIIIIVFKLYLGVNSKLKSGQELCWSLIHINTRIQMIIIIILKPYSRVNL